MNRPKRRPWLEFELLWTIPIDSTSKVGSKVSSAGFHPLPRYAIREIASPGRCTSSGRFNLDACMHASMHTYFSTSLLTLDPVFDVELDSGLRLELGVHPGMVLSRNRTFMCFGRVPCGRHAQRHILGAL